MRTHEVSAKPAAADAGDLPSRRFDSSQLAPGERFDRFRAALAPVLDLALPEDRPLADHFVRATSWELGGVLATVGTYSAQGTTRSSRLIRADQVDHYTVHLNLAPHTIDVDCDGQRMRVPSCTPVLTDLARPKTFHFDAGEVVSLFIPRQALDAVMPRALDLHGVVPRGACSTLFTSHLRTLAARLPGMTRGEAPGAMLATLHLLAASLAPSADSLALARPAAESTLRRQICAYIDQRVTQQDLSSQLICKQFRISRSTLYRLFEPLGGVANHIKECRLKRIHALLASPAQRVYLQRVAEDHGFKSPTHFSRAFREQFGYSPKEVKSRGAPPVVAAGNAAHQPSLSGWLQTTPA